MRKILETENVTEVVIDVLTFYQSESSLIASFYIIILAKFWSVEQLLVSHTATLYSKYI